jgi:predicted permease
MHTIARDIAVGWRRLRATPAFTFFAILTLALGIAAVTGAYGMVRALAAPPPGVPDVEELVTLSHSAYGRQAWVAFSWPDFEDLRRRQTTMGDVVAFTTTEQVLAVDGQSHASTGEIVSGNYFRMLRVQAALGRLIQPFDDQPGAQPVTVISHVVWQRVFGGRPDVIGRSVMLGGHPFEVVGVAPPGFFGLFGNGRFPVLSWVSLSTAHLFEPLQIEQRRVDRNARWLYLRARPAPGVTIGQVAAELRAIGGQLDQEHPIGTHLTDARYRLPHNVSRAWVARRTSDLLMDEAASYTGPPLVALLMAAVGLVLLVACTNLANLVVARGSVRRHELALRLALGATRAQLVAGCVAEVVIITAIGGVLAIGFTWLIFASLGGALIGGRGIVFLLQPTLDAGAFGVSLVATFTALVVAGVIPGLVLTSRKARGELVSGVAPTVVPRWRVRRVLIAGQVMVSIVLLATATLFLGQVAARSRIDTDVDIDRLAVAEVDLMLQNYDDERTARLVDLTLDRLTQHPAVEAATASAGLPFGPIAPTVTARVGDVQVVAQAIAVAPGFFDTIGIAVVHGVALDTVTARDGTPAVVIDTALAEHLFARIDVVGQQIDVTERTADGDPGQPAPRTIVGVVRTAAVNRPAARGGEMYLPLVTRPSFPLVFSARTSDDPARIAAEIRRALAAIEPDLGVSRAGGARALITPSTYFETLVASVTTLLGGIGLTVVLAGLYGVLSYLVSRRTRELGMRLALGATPRHVLVMVIREGLAPVMVGIVAGGALALVVWRLLVARMVAAAEGSDFALLAGVPLLMLIAAAIACYFPARRASHIDPAVALKQ